MAHTAPAPEDLILRYPAFAAVDEDMIQYWLTDAERFVDTTWMEADYAPALLALAAHNMTLGGIGAATGAGAFGSGVTRFKSGAVDVTISEEAASAQIGGGYGSTRYGREFAIMLRRNFGGPTVIQSGAAPCCGYFRTRLLG